MRARMSRSRSTSARLGHDPDRMAAAVEHFEDTPHHLMLAFDRLIGIRVGSDRDRARLVARGRELAFQQLGSIGLGEQLGLEVEAGREPEIGVGRPRETVDAAMLAAAVGIDRPVEGNVGRIVPGDDLARRIDRHRGLERRQLLEILPAVVEVTRASGSKRPDAFDCAPRPRRRSASTATAASGGALRSMAAGRRAPPGCGRPCCERLAAAEEPPIVISRCSNKTRT